MEIKSLKKYLLNEKSIAPLVVFRIAFGVLMLASITRFIYKGWVHSMYIMPKVYFPFYGFEWVKPLSPEGMYIVFGLMLVACVGIILGAFYRLSAVLFFLLFTYVELIDKTNYLNHYYFISLVSFLLIFIPAHKSFSIDNIRLKKQDSTSAPAFYLLLLQLQMFVVYFFAGIAKLNYDWLFEAQPLKIWLPAFSHYPVIGSFMEKEWVAYLFCWFGCIYDLSIGFFLFNRRTVNIAYVFVIIFHAATALFFNIGMFPYIMMTITIVFFKEEFHEKIINSLIKITGYKPNSTNTAYTPLNPHLLNFFMLYFVIQFVVPFRYALYPGKLFWTEQGYRFSWRVMLMEKAGTAFFFVKDEKSGRESEVDNKKYLTFLQEKMMATQPDMMVDYAKFLKEEYKKMGFTNPTVRAQSYVTLNGSGSREFINSTIDLSSQSNSFLKNKSWVKSY
ncbi:MAG: HTTM domain-containing protein [Bacteroidetes bacterium]|nr:HTTM domain-containing protein [Bacteroidota bacterium]